MLPFSLQLSFFLSLLSVASFLSHFLLPLFMVCSYGLFHHAQLLSEREVVLKVVLKVVFNGAKQPNW